MFNVIFLKNAAVEFLNLFMPEVRYLNHDISKKLRRYIVWIENILLKSTNFLKIQKQVLTEKWHLKPNDICFSLN